MKVSLIKKKTLSRQCRNKCDRFCNTKPFHYFLLSYFCNQISYFSENKFEQIWNKDIVIIRKVKKNECFEFIKTNVILLITIYVTVNTLILIKIWKFLRIYHMHVEGLSLDLYLSTCRYSKTCCMVIWLIMMPKREIRLISWWISNTLHLCKGKNKFLYDGKWRREIKNLRNKSLNSKTIFYMRSKGTQLD